MVRNIKTKCKNVESKLLCNGSSFYFRLVGTRIEMLRQMIRNDKKKSIEKGIGAIIQCKLARLHSERGTQVNFNSKPDTEWNTLNILSTK